MSYGVIKIVDLKKRYGDFQAVKGVTFEVKKGEIFGILGPNGAGKTSLLECIEGLRVPDDGIIEVAGINPLINPKELTKYVGVQLQASALPMSIKVGEALSLFSKYHNVKSESEFIEKMGLKEKLNKQFKELSGGEKRRLILALAIIHNPKVLILDEPTAALDVHSRVELHNIMEILRDRGTAILLATHDMAEAEKLCNRIAIMIKGEIVKIGTPKDIILSEQNINKIFVRTVNDSLKITEGKLVEEYYVFSTTNIGEKLTEILNIINTNDDELIDLRVERASLEERFIEMTSKEEN